MTLAPIPTALKPETKGKKKKEKKINPVKNPKSVEVQYRKQLETLSKSLAVNVENQLIPLLRRLESQYTNDSYAQELEEAFDRLRIQYSNIESVAKIAASKFVSSTNNVNKNRFYKSVENAIGIDLNSVMQNEGLEDILRATVRENVNLIKSIPEQYFKQIESIVFNGTITGSKAGSMIDQIKSLNGSTTKRARLIARDQTSKLNSAMTQQRSKNLGVVEYVWRTASDERVRDSHKRNNGKVFRWDDPPPTGHPGHDIQCFKGSVNVKSIGGINKLFRRCYTGEFSFFVTASSKRIESTPNHLHLTTRGWVAAKDINVGDYVIDISKQRSYTTETYNKEVVSFEDLFTSMSVGTKTDFHYGTAAQFHGDGIINHNVDIIDINRVLLNTIEPFIVEKLEKLALSFTYNPRTTQSPFNFTGSRGNRTSNSVVSIFSEIFPFIIGCITHSNVHRFRSTSHMDTISNKMVSYGFSIDTKLLRELQNTFSRDIFINDLIQREIFSIMSRSIMLRYNIPCLPEFNAESIGANIQGISGLFQCGTTIEHVISRVDQVGSENFSGHVYNLETKSNCYIADDILTHNCRCIAQAIINI